MNYNISHFFTDYAKANPKKIAFVEPVEYDSERVIKENILTYQDFHQKVANYRKGLIEAGFKKGDKIIILCPINTEFYAVMLAMFTLGLVAVLLDPGIGLKKILTAISDSKSQGVISLDKVLKYWPLVPPLWKMKRFSVDKTRWGVRALNDLHFEQANPEFQVEKLAADDHALITFTSGSTGRSKGADRNALNVYNQLQVIKNNWSCNENEIDFPIFLMFGFMNLLYGITTVLPAAEYKNIGNISPKVIANQMKKWKVTRMSGSYTFNDKLSQYLLSQNMTIETINNIVLGGTPVAKEFCESMKSAYPQAKIMMTYGSTEVAPISFCAFEELIATEAKGSFVGKPCKELSVKIVALPPGDFQGDPSPYEVEAGMWGEVIISGPHVVQKYLDNPRADKQNKINDGQRIWHRSGDTGYLDTHSNLILTGRLSDMIQLDTEIVHPYLVETDIDKIPAINRSALIKTKNKVILCYDKKDKVDDKVISKILKEHNLQSFMIKEVPKIPLDDRHNSKINRIKLKGMV